MKTISEILYDHNAHTPELATALQEHCADFLDVFLKAVYDVAKGDCRKMNAILHILEARQPAAPAATGEE